MRRRATANARTVTAIVATLNDEQQAANSIALTIAVCGVQVDEHREHSRGGTRKNPGLPPLQLGKDTVLFGLWFCLAKRVL